MRMKVTVKTLEAVLERGMERGWLDGIAVAANTVCQSSCVALRSQRQNEV